MAKSIVWLLGVRKQDQMNQKLEDREPLGHHLPEALQMVREQVQPLLKFTITEESLILSLLPTPSNMTVLGRCETLGCS